MNATKPQKSITITLHSGETTLRLLALRRADGSAISYATTAQEGTKGTTRGMTQQHKDLDAAKTAVAALATEAEGKGWARRAAGRGFLPKPDSFSVLPVAPKPAAKGSGRK